jgi:Ca2+-binding RTX toxin-like protein
MATPFFWGPEFLIPTTRELNQYDPAVVGLADGRMLMSWSDESSGDIKGQIFNADGSYSGLEFCLNSTVAGTQSAPRLTALDDGGFVVTFADDSAYATSANDVRVRVFAADATPVGDDFLVSTLTEGDQSSADVAMLADGSFVVAYDHFTSSGTLASDVLAAHFAADGTPLGDPVRVNTTTDNFQFNAAIAALDNGDYVVAWNGVVAGDASNSGVGVQIMTADGILSGGEILANSATSLNQENPAITALEGGRFVVTWDDASAIGADTSSYAIRGQVFAQDGTRLGAEFQINSIAANPQVKPRVTSLNDGTFVVVWEDDSTSPDDPSGAAIRAQVFDANGQKLGDEFLVNTITADNQRDPSVAALADGRFVIAWTDYSASPYDTSGAAIRAQIFDARASAVSLEGSMLNDDFVGTGWGDHMSGFLGDDTLAGAGGDDVLNGEDGNDRLIGGWGRDRLIGGAGNDALAGGSGNDKLFGGAGNDVLDGGFGYDYLAGGLGNDVYVIDRLGDLVVEARGAGADTVASANLNLVLGRYANIEHLRLDGSLDLNAIGNSADNRLTGNFGDNILLGGAGRDIIGGGAGADTLRGDAGRDLLFGGADADTFVYRAPTDSFGVYRDRIVGFEHGVDTIDLAAIDARVGAGNQAFSFIGGQVFHGVKGELRVAHFNANTYLQGDRDGDGHTDFVIELAGYIVLNGGDLIL